MNRNEVIEALRHVAPIQLMRLEKDTPDPNVKYAARRFLDESDRRGYWFSELVEYTGDRGLGRMEKYARVILKALGNEPE